MQDFDFEERVYMRKRVVSIAIAIFLILLMVLSYLGAMGHM